MCRVCVFVCVSQGEFTAQLDKELGFDALSSAQEQAAQEAANLAQAVEGGAGTDSSDSPPQTGHDTDTSDTSDSQGSGASVTEDGQGDTEGPVTPATDADSQHDEL